MHWEDFIITLGPIDAAGNCSVQCESALGEASCISSITALKNRLPGAGNTTDPIRDADRDVAVQPAPRLSPRETGEELFNLLFTDRCRDLFSMTEGFVAATRRGLRVVLKIDLEGADGQLLQSLPWELLYQTSKREFIALMKNRSIVRYLELLQPLGSATLTPPVRVIAVSSLPAGFSQLDLPREEQNLRKAWAGARLKALNNVPIGVVADEIEKTGPYQIFHFMGHAGFNGGTGVLFFTDPVDGEQLATTLAFQQGNFRLAILNACRTGQIGAGRESDPYAGLAASLAIHGVPAIVAMRERISDPAAIRFSKAVHEQLADGKTLDEAVGVGRRVILVNEDHEKGEWSQPILFLRAVPPSADLWSHLYASLSKLPPWMRRISKWGGALAGLFLGLLLIATLAIGQHVSPADIPWLESLALLGLMAMLGTFLGRDRFAYDALALALSAVFLFGLMAVWPLVPRRTDIALADVGNPSGWMACSLPPDQYIDLEVESDGCRSDNCLKFTYHRGDGQCYAGVYWIPWVCPDGLVEGRDCSINLLTNGISHIHRLSFYARGQHGGEVLEFKVGADDFPPPTVKLTNVVLSKQWRRYTIPLDGVDLTHAVGLFAWFAADVFNREDITFYLDEMTFEGVSCPLDRK